MANHSRHLAVRCPKRALRGIPVFDLTTANGELRSAGLYDEISRLFRERSENVAGTATRACEERKCSSPGINEPSNAPARRQ